LAKPPSAFNFARGSHLGVPLSQYNMLILQTVLDVRMQHRHTIMNVGQREPWTSAARRRITEARPDADVKKARLPRGEPSLV